MIPRSTHRFATVLLIVGGAVGGGSARGQLPEEFGSYRTAADFELRDVQSQRTIKLSDYFKAEAETKNVVVLAFTGVDCPVGDLYMPRLAELSEAYKGRGVTFLAINSNAHDTVEQVAEHARRFGSSSRS